jgi:citrate lyase subunit beta/citryl-CoA lyase
MRRQARSALRSYLYVPGDAGDRLLKAGGRGADAVIADLEDAVAPAGRPAARVAVSKWIHGARPRTTERWVRVNAGNEAATDLRAIYAPGLDGVVVPKVDNVDELNHMASTLAEIVQVGDARPAVMALIETARGVQNVESIAAHPVVDFIQLGEIDLAADLGLDPDPAAGSPELLHVRSRVVVAAAAARIAPPIGAVTAEYQDLDGLRTSTIQLRRLGFVGRAAIHPNQLSVIHDAFTPSADEVRLAMNLVASYEQVIAEGAGVMTDSSGRMIDRAVVRAAQRTIAFAANRDPRT